jgi:hypothetical protein
MTLRLIISVTLLLHFSVCSAQLQPMDDSDLEQVSGQLGIVLDGVKLIGDTDTNLQLSFDTDIAADGGTLDNVSIVGSGNGSACNAWDAANLPSLGSCNGINIGSSTDPITFDVNTESGVSYIELKTPTAWTRGIDLNFRLVAYGQGFDKDGSGTISPAESNLIFADPVWVQAKNIRIPDSYIRVWSNNTNLKEGASGFVNGGDDVGASFAGNLNLTIGELNIDYSNSRGYNTITQSYEAFAPNSGVTASSTTGDGPLSGSGFVSTNGNSNGSTRGLLKLTNISISNLSMGVFPYMPLHFGSLDNGVGNQPGFFVEVPMLSNDPTLYNDFYANVPKTNISVGSFQLGDGANRNIGSANLTGVRIQHLKVELGS